MALVQRLESPGVGGTALASRRCRFVLNTMEVEVRDVADAATVVAIRQTVHHTFSHLVGAWYVRLSAVDTRGRWDLRVRGAFGQHVAGFLAAPPLVAEVVERELRSFLRGVVPPLSARPSRPTLVMRPYRAVRPASSIEWLDRRGRVNQERLERHAPADAALDLPLTKSASR
jgi:hypothetical protein